MWARKCEIGNVSENSARECERESEDWIDWLIVIGWLLLTKKKAPLTGGFFRIKLKSWGMLGLGIDISESEEKEINISYTSWSGSKCFDFGIKWFCWSNSAAIVEKVKNVDVVS